MTEIKDIKSIKDIEQFIADINAKKEPLEELLNNIKIARDKYYEVLTKYPDEINITKLVKQELENLIDSVNYKYECLKNDILKYPQYENQNFVPDDYTGKSISDVFREDLFYVCGNTQLEGELLGCFAVKLGYARRFYHVKGEPGKILLIGIKHGHEHEIESVEEQLRIAYNTLNG